MMIALNNLPNILPPLRNEQRLELGAFNVTAMALLLQACVKKYRRPILCVTSENQLIDKLADSLSFFNADDHLSLHLFPDWEILPYDRLSPYPGLTSARLSTLYRLPSMEEGIVLSSITTLSSYLMPASFLFARSVSLSVDDVINLDQFHVQLHAAEYTCVGQVKEQGEYAKRGSIVDIYPMGSKVPYRIEWFDNTVSSIREFDVETQLSLKKVKTISLLPAHEYALSEECVKRFRQNWRTQFSGNPLDCPMYTAVSDARPCAGAEFYLPLFFEEKQTIFDYLPKHTVIIYLDDVQNSAQQFWNEIKNRFDALSGDRIHPLCQPADLFIRIDKWYQQAKQFTRLQVKSHQTDNQDLLTVGQPLPTMTFDSKLTRCNTSLQDFIASYTGRVVFAAETKGRCQVILDLLKPLSVFPVLHTNWSHCLASTEPFNILVAPTEGGVQFADIAFITEDTLLGEHVYQRRRRMRDQVDVDLLVQHLSELNPGDPVVHVEHGIGRYEGLTQIKTSQHEAEYITLKYARGDKIYVPITSLHLLTRYTGMDIEHVPLHALGKRQWEKAKEKAFKRIRDVAAELLDVYSRRQMSQGFVFRVDNLDIQRFAQSFPFEETPDQAQAIEAVFEDMRQTKCMDRLICGDVGFGKTEIAMRAAFAAVHNNKQVVVLVPTTLLASQHLQTFKERFSGWSVTIDALFRFKTLKEQQLVIHKVAQHKIDILIGTHAVLNQKIKFKALGLLILDEEHRFGVRQKEKIKSWRANIDVLTLTATPIPRTLNMALLGTRDLSIITTPPSKRLPIKTFIQKRNDYLLREAILREVMRGGQVYFLHNDVISINSAAEKLKTLLPTLQFAIAHGQMPERELEKVMFNFYHGRYHVLVCSTIIESGIDVPTANTIIIEKANRFGLAQLHQLRGRVGRSHHQAYAYLLTPNTEQISSDAKKRLKVISELEDLGAGFYLASHDLEIRGAGDLLGDAQSGHIQSIGFSLYMELLKDTVRTLKKGGQPVLGKMESFLPDVNIPVSALFPETYMMDVNMRLVCYKRLAEIRSQEELFQLKTELIDRFGALPIPAQALFQLTELKLLAKALNILSIDEKKEYFYFHFQDPLVLNIDKLIKWVQHHAATHQLKGYVLRILCPAEKPSLDALSEWLKHMYETMLV
jgi:transcription-repair coupling factor (superfamily II helicase)